MRRRDIPRAFVLSATVPVLLTGRAEAQSCPTGPCYPLAPGETKSLVTNYSYPPGDARRYGVVVGGMAGSNATGIQNAINSGQPIITLPAGDISFSTGLVIDRALRLDGAGSCGGDNNASGQPGVSTTRLLYSGTGDAIRIVGSGTEGK